MSSEFGLLKFSLYNISNCNVHITENCLCHNNIIDIPCDIPLDKISWSISAKKKKKSETRAVQYSPLNLNLFVYYYANMDIQILQVILQNLMYLDWHSLPPCSPLQSFTVYCQSGDHQCLLLLILHRWKHGVPWIWLSRHLYATTNLWDHYIVCIVKMEDMWSVVRVVGKSSGS